MAQDQLETAEPATDGICFHCQQAIEKALKAWLIWVETDFQPIHNIEVLLAMCEGSDESFRALRAVESLTPYAVGIGYGDDYYLPSVEEAREALALATQTVIFVQDMIAARGFDIPT